MTLFYRSRLALSTTLLMAVACTSATGPAPIVIGVTYELIALDGHAAPFEFEMPARFAMVLTSNARVHLRFEDSASYSLVVHRAPQDAGLLYRSSYRQLKNGIVQLMGYGTFTDGVSREFVEGGGVPRGDELRLETIAPFIYGAHVWTFRRR
ncbi:MAG TPA: hypothetical protein VJ717_15460 [Gemmatimonadaceae bacterium]|nr:hypothetical protein [Gemmatimonadaceae bacterium]